jgi:hypothetical protein
MSKCNSFEANSTNRELLAIEALIIERCRALGLGRETWFAALTIRISPRASDGWTS